jgi:hypothetical protein
VAPKTEQVDSSVVKDEAAPAPDSTEADRRRKAYAVATTVLRDRHRREFDELYEAECAKLGVSYKRRLSEEEKAEKQVEELLAKHPDLRSKFSTGPSED